MEACRLYAMVALLFLIPGAPPFPFAAALCALAGGTLLGRGFSFIRRRRVFEFFVYGAGGFAFVFFSAGAYSDLPFWLAAGCVALFWLRGARIGGGKISHGLTVNRYDIGAGVFFFMYFLRMGLKEPDPLALRLMGAYFLFSILALFSSRCRDRDNNFISARSAASLLLPFMSVFFLAAGAIVLLYPLLTQTAGNVYTFLWDNSGPLRDLLVIILRVLFGFGRRTRADAASTPAQNDSDFIPAQESAPPGVLEKIIFWVLVAAVAAAVLVLAIWLVITLARYLAGRTGTGGGKPGLFEALRTFFAFIKRLLREALRALHAAKIFTRHPPAGGAGQEAFRGLCDWGRVSGIPRRPSETPSEYSLRLAARFPSLREPAGILTWGLHAELYGKKELSGKDIALLRGARRRLASPALIPARITCRLGFRK
jgi:hypothetical protein